MYGETLTRQESLHLGVYSIKSNSYSVLMMRIVTALGAFGVALFIVVFWQHTEPGTATSQLVPEPHEAIATTTEYFSTYNRPTSTPPTRTSKTLDFEPRVDAGPQQEPDKNVSPPTDGIHVVRLEHPYNMPSLSMDALNAAARSAVVNILCIAAGNELQPMSASGIVIGNGVILTNAHVAQYVLLQDYSPIAITCLVRNGSPAQVIGQAHIAFISDIWLQTHAPHIISENQTGTGENDVALLTIAPRESNSPPPIPLPVDSREAVAFQGDVVTIASYPAGFLGGLTIERSLALVSTVASIGKLYSFQGNTIDMFSVGGTIVAQGGSSGSPVLNDHGYAVGMITTSSDGATTDTRDLRALTTSHIDRVLRQEMGMSLSAAVLNAPEYARTHTKNLAAQAKLLTTIIFQ